MPNKETFKIKPIKSLIHTWFLYASMMKPCYAIDPFCRNSPFNDRCKTNDLDTSVEADSHLDALEFLQSFADSSVDLVLFDPPYSPRQVSECYKKLDKTVNMQTTQSSYWGNMKKEIARIVKPNGLVITCGWNSGGMGKSNGFDIEEILMVAHGGWHNDTIVTVDRCNRLGRRMI